MRYGGGSFLEKERKLLVPQNSIEELENLLVGGKAEEIAKCVFWNSRLFFERRRERNRNIDFLAKGLLVNGKQRWWWIEVKSNPFPMIEKAELDKKPKLRYRKSKVIHINRTEPPYIRVMTHPYIADEKGIVHFTTALRDDEEFTFDGITYEFYEGISRFELLLPRLYRDPELRLTLESLFSRVREESAVYNLTPGA